MPDDTIDRRILPGPTHGAADPAGHEQRLDHFVETDGGIYAGTHLIVDVIGGDRLNDQPHIHQTLLDCVEASGATLLHIHLHAFSPQGISGVAVLAESHISVHTWPEIGFGAFDIFMCGDTEPWKAVDVLRDRFRAREVRVKELHRGNALVPAA